MKKVLLVLTAVAAMACTKEEVKAPNTNCDCGTITDVYHVLDVDTINDIAIEYYDFSVTNDCSGNSEIFTTQFDSPLGDNATPVVGDKYCK